MLSRKGSTKSGVSAVRLLCKVARLRWSASRAALIPLYAYQALGTGLCSSVASPIPYLKVIYICLPLSPAILLELAVCRFVPYASVVAANTPEYTQQLADLSVGAIKNPNGTFVAPSASAPFPFASSALPQSIVSSQWATLNASASSEFPGCHTTLS